MGPSTRNPWEGYLPRKAIVMARQDSVAAPLAALSSCTSCKLRVEGDAQAALVFMGEESAGDAEPQSRPFAGKAGELLDKMVEAMGLRRNQVYLMTFVRCPGRDAACDSFLSQQLDLIRPKVVVALGAEATRTLLKSVEPLTSLRGRLQSFRDYRLMPTWHPEDLLRTPDMKREAWTDLQSVARELGLVIPRKPA